MEPSAASDVGVGSVRLLTAFLELAWVASAQQVALGVDDVDVELKADASEWRADVRGEKAGKWMAWSG